ncbi:MAG TPA: hypothetical protein VMW35_01085 [Myxococcota bacterium]|nr:hypothetical protein [Myxococcota bacterium]
MSEGRRPVDRRTFLRDAAGALLWTALVPLAGGAFAAQPKPPTKPKPGPATTPAGAGPGAPAPTPQQLPAATIGALEDGEFVYVSPLRTNGDESTCHGEVWFAWLDAAVVIITAQSGWKARSLAAGHDRARLWVGSYGRWKQMMGRSEAFRAGPHFDARAQRATDPALLERLIASYEKKYPNEIGSWRDKFRAGFASGERWLVRYEPKPD